jgi:Uma2 family endonuclease
MALAFDPVIHRMTVEQYEQFVTDHQLDRVELIDGVICDVSPESFDHSDAAHEIFLQLRDRFPDKLVRMAGSVRLDDESLWNPDVYVLDVAPGASIGKYPVASDVLVAVEVSVSTWARDAGPKLAVYARNGIPDYWVLRPGDGWTLTQFSNPKGAEYRRVVTVDLPDGPGALPPLV